MFGLVFAALWVAFCVVINKSSVDLSVISALSFLWYWHITWGCVKCVLPVGSLLIGMFGAIFGESSGERLAFAGGGLAVAIILVVAIAITSALFLGGVYCFQEAVVDGKPIQDWDATYMIIGGVLYGVGCLLQISTRGHTSNSK